MSIGCSAVGDGKPGIGPPFTATLRFPESELGQTPPMIPRVVGLEEELRTKVGVPGPGSSRAINYSCNLGHTIPSV